MRQADRRLLVVDVVVFFACFLLLAIEDQYEVAHAESASRMRSLLKGYQPDVILFDLLLPDANGIELIHEIKKYAANAIIVMMTAYATVESAVAALKVGAADYFTKPLDIAKRKHVRALL